MGVELYEPINTLKRVGEDLWVVDGPIVRMAFPGASVPFPTRMVVVRLAGGELFLWSPTEPDEGLRKEIDALGPVRHLVSPNKLHYVHVCAWKRAYPKPRRGPHRGRGSGPPPETRRSASIVTSRTSPRRRDAGTWNN